jgi:DNA-binding NarL/FixJ family response regulator
MRTDLLENVYAVQMRDIRSIKQQIRDAMGRIARGVSAEAMGQALMKLLETTEHHVARLDRLFKDAGPALADGFRGRAPRDHDERPNNYALLTSREAEVLQLIAEGYGNKQIAAELAISIKTVEKHRQRMMAKLNLHDTAGVTRYAIAAGVVDASL